MIWLVVSTYPSEKKYCVYIYIIIYMYVSWDDDISNIWKHEIHVPNHQPVYDLIWIHEDFLEHLGIFSIYISSCCIHRGVMTGTEETLHKNKKDLTQSSIYG